MTLVVGPYTLIGTDQQNEILKPMAQAMADTLKLGDVWRVRPTRVHVLPRDQMPWATKPDEDGKGGVRARGFWDHPKYNHDILLADDLFAAPTGGPDLARKTFAHEGTHQLQADWMLRSNERSIKPLFDPDAAGFPAEEFAVYGSAAIFGFDNPPYKGFYDKFVIPKSMWAKTKEYALRDDHPVVVEPPPIEPPPTTTVIEVKAGETVTIKGV